MAPEPRKSARVAEALWKKKAEEKEAQKKDQKAKRLAKRKAAQASRQIDPKATFLAKLYAEVAGAAQPAQSRTRSPLNRVDALGRLARTTHFLYSISRTRRRKCREDLISLQNQQSNSSVQRVLRDVAEDVRQFDSLLASRLEACVTSFGYPMLSICLHSSTFCTTITSTDSNDRIRWDQKFDELALSSSSLELFAKPRQLDFEEPIRSSNDHFRTLIHHRGSTFTDDELQPLTGGNFGMKDTENRTRHLIDPEFCSPHLWILPSDNSIGASRPEFKCRNNKKLKAAYPGSSDDRMFSRLHEDIQQSVVLSDYHWPQQDYWPEKDPRYAGFEGDACIGFECPKKTKDLFPRKKRTPDYIYERCGCNRNRVGKYYGTPLVELYTTNLRGTGVRALQNIADDSILDAYLGEIYAFFTKDDKGAVPPRYGSGLGAAYRMKGAISKRHPKPNAPKRGRNSTTSSSSVSPPRKRSSKENGRNTISSAAADLYASEYTHFAIDSAWRGNWTRYINHSCDPNTQSQSQNVGMRTEILVEAIRDIEFGEEITIDYSHDYFISQRFACKCGVKTCKRDERNKMGNQVMLADAIAQGNAPGWAVNANGSPKRGVVVEPKGQSAKRKAESGRCCIGEAQRGPVYFSGKNKEPVYGSRNL